MPTWTPEQVAAALDLAALKGPAQASRETGIPTNTIKSWRKRKGQSEPAVQSQPVATVAPTATVQGATAQPHGRTVRGNNGRFVPGQSGNPGGRTSAIAEAKRRAEERAPDAIDLLWTIASDEEQPGSVRVAAVNGLLDRGLGKPKQSVDMDVKGEVVERNEQHYIHNILADPAAVALAQRLALSVEGKPGDPSDEA